MARRRRSDWEIVDLNSRPRSPSAKFSISYLSLFTVLIEERKARERLLIVIVTRSLKCILLRYISMLSDSSRCI